ncbi:hypothetical protein PILCRDRAFT_92502 [Piloderma croceum F 1598]|uniref:Uncharacterized protein n=1 Tax=Piloderma croceum (strain F 1598) TaxID=765440 RepID=A0A0C3F3N9_PILCF|nr:hypothetical protein PILCRDRAFT_92502 [Piloderma croceum F 1598]
MNNIPKPQVGIRSRMLRSRRPPRAGSGNVATSARTGAPIPCSVCFFVGGTVRWLISEALKEALKEEVLRSLETQRKKNRKRLGKETVTSAQNKMSATSRTTWMKW